MLVYVLDGEKLAQAGDEFGIAEQLQVERTEIETVRREGRGSVSSFRAGAWSLAIEP